MRIVADENIPYVREAFKGFGEVVTAPGRAMDAGLVREADVLLVRSVTPVDAGLLDGSRVRFVGTATIGTDHVDEAYLADRGIAFASAPGSNAESVAEWFTAALLLSAGRGGWTAAGRSVGIIGVGNVGTQVLSKVKALGMAPILNDPPLARATGDATYRPLDEALDADVVTLHVPLTQDGPDVTHHMVDEAFLARLKDGAVLFNAARGAVVDSAALHRAMDAGRLAAVALDTWEHEPAIDPDLLRKVDLGTPHIAGYSFDGKVNGTVMLHDALRAFLGKRGSGLVSAPRNETRPLFPPWRPDLPPADVPQVEVTAPGEDGLRQAVLAVYDIERDDAALRRLIDLPRDQHGPHFVRLRKEYPRRRAFPCTSVTAPEDLHAALAGLGFRVAASDE